MTASIRSSVSTTTALPTDSNIRFAFSRTGFAFSFAKRALAPWPIRAGVLGITRTMGLSPRVLAIWAIFMPAAMDITVVSGLTESLMLSRASVIFWGLTASTSVSMLSVSDWLSAALFTPYSFVRYSSLSGRISLISMFSEL